VADPGVQGASDISPDTRADRITIWGPISLTTSPDNMPRTGCSYQYTTPYCRFLFWAIFKTRKPPRLRGPALSICYQKVVPKVRVELTRGHPHRFLSLVRVVLI